MIFGSTPSQTVGPYLSLELPWELGPCAVPQGTPGSFWIRGVVLDGDGKPVGDSLIETWQADPEGRFADMYGYGGPSQLEGFRGFARYGREDGDGSYQILTVKPGPVPGLNGATQAPHIDVSVLARGMLNRCVTRIYFPDEAGANAQDPVLQSVPSDRRSTLIAVAQDDGYRFDIRLQGEGETVFFDV